MSSSKLAYRVVAASSLLAALLAAHAGCRKGGHSPAEYAHRDARQIAISLAGYVTDFPQDATNVVNDARGLYDTLCGASNAYGVTYLDPPERWRASRRCIDGWGNAFHAEIVHQRNAAGEMAVAGVRVWSNGPNQVDDGGTEDDVVFERRVEPEENRER